jgi:hypothetical protein
MLTHVYYQSPLLRSSTLDRLVAPGWILSVEIQTVGSERVEATTTSATKARDEKITLVQLASRFRNVAKFHCLQALSRYPWYNFGGLHTSS